MNGSIEFNGENSINAKILGSKTFIEICDKVETRHLTGRNTCGMFFVE